MQTSERMTNDPRDGLRRLFRMGLPELACRSRQEALKWAERVHSVADSHHECKLETASRDSESVRRFLRNAEESFFEGPLDARLLEALPTQHCDELVAAAEKIGRLRFDLLGYREVDFGDPPDWHLDPISGRRAPFVHWTRLDSLDYASLGDSKVICELNRHQWLVHLGQAYRLTREERYAETLVHHLRSWLDANPPGMGINWTSSLEVGLRIIAWCWALTLIRDSDAFNSALLAELAKSVQAHATHVERYLSYYFSPNTHLTGEALGLLYAAVVFPGLKRAERWRSLATHILVQEIERQVLSDGVYFERSTCYQRYTVDTYLHFMILASRAGLEVPAIVRERVQSMLGFLLAVRQPDGSMPSIGDADGGRLLPLSRNEPDDFRPTFSTAAVLFRNSAYSWAAGELAPETLWLLGCSAAEIFEAIEPSPPTSEPSRLFPDGGFAVMRSGWEGNSHSLIFDAGPLGCPVSSGHGHADLLSIQCSAFGQPYLVDAGTCSYAERELRDFFRGTAAHSTIMVDGNDQAQPGGPFAWQSRSTAKLLQWFANETLASAEAEHDGYRVLPDPVCHRRRVIFVKRRYWVVIDELTGAGTHRVEIRFQFAPMDVRIDTAGWVRATRDGRHGLLLRAFTTAAIEGEIRQGCRAPLDGWTSPNYGQLEPAPVMVYSATTLLPVRVATLLWPTESVHHETPPVKASDLNELCSSFIIPSSSFT